MKETLERENLKEPQGWIEIELHNLDREHELHGRRQMKRWNEKEQEEVENPRIDAFLNDLEAVCKQHGLSLSCEDDGDFVVTDYNDYDARDMANADDCIES